MSKTSLTYSTLSVAVIVVFLMNFGMTHAQNESGTQDTRAVQKTAVAERVQARILNLSENITSRAFATSARFDAIIARIESRIVKLNAQNVDTTSAQNRLQEAKASLAIANEQLNGIGSIRDAVSSEKPREAFIEIRKKLMDVRTSFIDTRTALIDTVALLKEAVKNAGLDKGASSAVSSSSDPTNN